jgi:hypothetical protein
MAVRRVTVCGLLLLALDARPAVAQPIGYVAGGLTTVSGFFGSLSGFNVAGGAEFLAAERVGAAAEFGYLGNASSILQVVSANGIVHLWTKPGTDRYSLFATSGYTRMSSGEGAFDAWNVGAGFDTWHGRKGLRFEFRDQIRPDRRGTVHYLSIRVGAVFR